MDDAFDIGKVVENRERVVEGFADMEGDRQPQVASELEHLLEEANLGGAVERFVMIVEADFSDRDELRARFRGTNESGEGLRVDDWRLGVRVGIFGVDAVSTEDVFMGGGEGLGGRGILGVGADDDDLINAGSMSILKELLGLVGREPFLVVEVTM